MRVRLFLETQTDDVFLSMEKLKSYSSAGTNVCKVVQLKLKRKKNNLICIIQSFGWTTHQKFRSLIIKWAYWPISLKSTYPKTHLQEFIDTLAKNSPSTSFIWCLLKCLTSENVLPMAQNLLHMFTVSDFYKLLDKQERKFRSENEIVPIESFENSKSRVVFEQTTSGNCISSLNLDTFTC